MHAMEISRTALDVEWKRLEIISENIANANVAGPTKGGSYRELHLISAPKNDFSALLDPKNPQTGAIDIDKLAGVEVLGVEAGSAPPRMVREPGNPQADASGFVAYPNIDQAAQMSDMIRASRAYEANIVAMSSERDAYSKALQLGDRHD